jgi:N-acetylglucosamine kinase-like BadF-type ATPase
MIYQGKKGLERMPPLTDLSDDVPRGSIGERGKLFRYWLGVDGGGTNCRAELYYAPADPFADLSRRLAGRGRAEAANFHRVGLESAVNSVKKAVGEACREAGITPAQIHAACVGLAGVQHPKHHRQMMDALTAAFPIPDISLETDARVALAGATGLKPGVVIIAGTGSIACGTNAHGEFARAGGWGPTMGDEGSGYYIGRRALEAAMAAYDHRAEPTSLTEKVCAHFGVASPPELPSVIYSAPATVMREIAQLSKAVVEAAREGDATAQRILSDAATELARAVVAVIKRLGLRREAFQVAYVGGVFEAGEFVLAPLRATVNKFAERATVAPPQFPPVVGAVKMAMARRLRNERLMAEQQAVA